eukprot:3353160-Lingulodinium_polyedra.AAC.1
MSKACAQCAVNSARNVQARTMRTGCSWLRQFDTMFVLLRRVYSGLGSGALLRPDVYGTRAQ